MLDNLDYELIIQFA